tara:strand:+ start:6978 stop:8360 length:1383 start_codon:yes stop_codon:yes gene_type:complete
MKRSEYWNEIDKQAKKDKSNLGKEVFHALEGTSWQELKKDPEQIKRLDRLVELEVKHSNKMCTAPFNSLYIGQHNRVSHCCASRYPIGDSSKNSLTEIMHGKESINIRKDMLNHLYHKHCDSCNFYEQQTKNIHPIRSFWKQYKFPRANVRTNGTMKKDQIRFLDLLFSNKCNFACMGCTPELSSTIAEKYMDAYDTVLDGGARNTQFWENDHDDVINYMIKHQDTIHKIHLNGGEPLMQVGVHKLLEAMLEHGLHKKIKIWTHTNGSIRKYKGKDIIKDYLSNWGELCDVQLSHDLHYERGEYVRYGLVTKKWEDTLYRLMDCNVNLTIANSYCIFNVLHLESLYDYYRNTLKTDHRIKMSMQEWTSPRVFSAPMAQFDTVIFQNANRQIKKMKHYMNSDEGMCWNLDSMKALLNSKWSDDDNKKHKKTFKIAIDAFDKSRNTDFLTTFPELKNLYYLN